MGKSVGFDIVLDFVGSSGILTVIDDGGDSGNGGGGGTGGYYDGGGAKVEGASTGQEGGQTGGQTGGRGEFVAAAETGPAGSISPTPTAGAVAGESTCLPIPWWPFGYVLLLLILGTAQKMEKKSFRWRNSPANHFADCRLVVVVV